MCRTDPARDPTYAVSLLRHATDLQIEAETLIQTLDLRAMLESLGPTELVGSVASGLMVWRDIDFCVDCPGLSPERAWDVLRPVLIAPQLTRLDYRNETGERTPDGDPTDQRLYLVLRYEAEPGVEWKIDLSLWTVASPRPGRPPRRAGTASHGGNAAGHLVDQGRLAPAAGLSGRHRRLRGLRCGAQPWSTHAAGLRPLPQ